MKIIQNTLKIQNKISNVSKNFLGRPHKSRVGRVSGNETFLFWPEYRVVNIILMWLKLFFSIDGFLHVWKKAKVEKHFMKTCLNGF